MHDDEVCECCGWRPEPEWMEEPPGWKGDVPYYGDEDWMVDWQDAILVRSELPTCIADPF